MIKHKSEFRCKSKACCRQCRMTGNDDDDDDDDGGGGGGGGGG